MSGEDPERYKVGDATFADLPKLQVSNNSGDDVATYVLGNEDHTLGNSLRYLIMKDPRVEFCGYNMPHPSERKCNLRIQTQPETTTQRVLSDAITHLGELCDHMGDTFEAAAARFAAEYGVERPPGDEEDLGAEPAPALDEDAADAEAAPGDGAADADTAMSE